MYIENGRCRLLKCSQPVTVFIPITPCIALDCCSRRNSTSPVLGSYLLHNPQGCGECREMTGSFPVLAVVCVLRGKSLKPNTFTVSGTWELAKDNFVVFMLFVVKNAFNLYINSIRGARRYAHPTAAYNCCPCAKVWPLSG